MAAESDLIVRSEPPVVSIRLNRPDRRNAFHGDWIPRITAAFRAAGDDREARLVLLSAEGNVFCAGADVEWMRSASNLTEEENRADALRMAEMFAAVAECPLPVVARVQGAALGGGCGLIAASDIAVAARDTLFGFTEARLGIIPAVISPFVLRKVHPGDARRYFLTGERFDAAEAHRIGLVQIVAELADLDAAVERLIHELVAAAPVAQGEAKKLLRELPRLAPQDIAATTSAWTARLRVGPEAREGFAAFFERRRPSWTERNRPNQ